jgi:type I restriction enzyme S subunit
MNLNTFKIDKTSWKPVKFGDVVAEPKEICKDIIAEGIEHVVGLEHIDTGDLHLRKFETTEESTTFSKKFRKGDVLFGRRRAYLKKAAKADFDGICSGDITVFRAKKELSPSLLPYIVNNDKFFDYAVKHSAGGLSPRVKFKDLSKYEFLLPQKDEQEILAEFLVAMDDLIESEKKVLDKLELTERLSLSILFEKSEIKKEIFLKDLYNNKFKTVNPSKYKNKQVLHYSLPSFMENQSPEVVDAKLIKSNKILLNQDTVLFSKLNPNRPKIWAVINDDKFDRLGSTEWLPVNPNKDFNMEYILAFLSSETFLRKVMRFVQGTSNSHKRVDPKRFYGLKIPLLSTSDSKSVVDCLLHYQMNKKNVLSKIISSQTLQKSFINHIF